MHSLGSCKAPTARKASAGLPTKHGEGTKPGATTLLPLQMLKRIGREGSVLHQLEAVRSDREALLVKYTAAQVRACMIQLHTSS